MGSKHFPWGHKYSTVYHEMDGSGKTAPTPTVLLTHEGMQVVFAISDLAAHKNCTNDVGLDVFEDAFGLENGINT
jgi:hypothetical protein